MFLQFGNRVCLSNRCGSGGRVGLGFAQFRLERIRVGFQGVCLGFQFGHIVSAFRFGGFGGFHCRLVGAGSIADLLLEFGHCIFCRSCRNGGAVFGVTHSRFGFVGHGFQAVRLGFQFSQIIGAFRLGGLGRFHRRFVGFGGVQ